MPRLTSPETGVTVSVDDEYAEQLKGEGWKAAAAKSARKVSAKSE